MTKETVLYSGPVESLARAEAALGEHYAVIRCEPERTDFEKKIVDAVALLDASMKVPVDATLLALAPKLRLIVVAATGADHIDEAAVGARGIPVLTLKGQTELLRNITAAAEHSWLLMQAAARHLRAATHHVEAGRWERVLFPGIMMRGKTLGLVGFGRIGSWMARYAHAFDMNIIAYDPYIQEFPEYVKSATLEDVLAQSHFISLHVHLTDETKQMLNAARFAQMQRGVVIVNTARGDLIEESAMVAALQSGQVRAYATDFIATEPEPEKSVLWQFAQKNENVLITPHIGGFCPEAVDIVVEFSAGRIRDTLQA